MWNVSEKYKTEIVKRTITSVWYGHIDFADSTSISFSQENIDQNKSKLTKQCVKGENLEIGNVFSGELVLGLRDSENWTISSKSYDYYGATIVLYFKLFYGDGTNESVPCGSYKITDAKRTYHTVELTAYDFVHDLEAKIPTKFVGTLSAYDVLSACCGFASVTLGETRESVEALPNGTYEFPVSVYDTGTTCSEIIGDICTFLGVNVIASRTGSIKLLSYGLESVRTIAASNRYGSSYVDYIGQYTKFAYVNKKGNEVEYGNASLNPSATKALTMNLGRNNLIKKMDTADVNGLLGNTLTAISDVIYAPCDVTMPSDPALDVGDMVTISGGELASDVYILNTKMTLPLFGQMKIVSEGGNYKLDASNTRTKKEKDTRNDEIDQSDKNDEIDTQIDDIGTQVTDISDTVTDLGGDVSDLKDDVADLQVRINVSYVMPTSTNLNPIADGGTSTVMEFQFSCANQGEIVSLYSMLTFVIATTLSTNQYNDARLTVSYVLDNTLVTSAVHTYTDGNMILTLNGLFTDLSVGNHVLDVIFAMSGGSLS